jgi:hypothetical protein
MEIFTPVFEALAFLLEATVWAILTTLILLAIGIVPIRFEKITIICANKDSYDKVLTKYGIILEDPEDEEDSEEDI